jgi:hypothetical protein
MSDCRDQGRRRTAPGSVRRSCDPAGSCSGLQAVCAQKPLFAVDETIFTSTCALQLNSQGLKRRPRGSGCTHAKRPLVVVQLEALTMNEYSFEAKHGAVLRVKFVLVSGRTPRPQYSCALCCEPIGDSYLREIATRLSYCGHKCYVDHCKVPVRALQNHARAS